MAPLVGREISVKVFMPRYAEMCTDALFHVRKMCATNFGDMCAVVGQENVEEHLVSDTFIIYALIKLMIFSGRKLLS